MVNSIGNALKQLRTDRKLTQKQVADKLGISQSYISRLEKKIIRQLKNDLDKAV